VPQADLTVVVIANLGSIDPWRQARAIATLALEGDKRLKPALPVIREADIKPLSGSWFNADEPALFDLGWRNGEATVTQNGMPFALARRADGWLAAERGSFEFALKPGQKGTARVDLGAGRVLTFKKLGRRKAVPAAVAGRYVSADSGAIWEIRRSGEEWAAAVGGPLIAGGAPWPVRGIDSDTVEVESPGSWLQVTQLAHLVRDRAGRIVALEVSTGRIKKMRFERAE
jgi:D-aminopeptidase